MVTSEPVSCSLTSANLLMSYRCPTHGVISVLILAAIMIVCPVHSGHYRTLVLNLSMHHIYSILCCHLRQACQNFCLKSHCLFCDIVIPDTVLRPVNHWCSYLYHFVSMYHISAILLYSIWLNLAG